MSEMLQHLVIARHGQSEGDVRRAAWRRGESYETDKTPEEEGITPQGERESVRGGQFIQREILGRYALKYFDYFFVSKSPRSEQSAVAMDLPDAFWQEDPRLNERDRGLIRGLRKEQHRALYPESYAQMLADPLHWVPPGGKSMMDMADMLADFYEDIRNVKSAIIVGHRDSMWAFAKMVEGLSDEAFAAYDTESISNGQIWHYTSLDPATGKRAPQLMWKYVVDPMHPETSAGWQILPHIAERYNLAA
jgi:broad specificity phosphatase PhoE